MTTCCNRALITGGCGFLGYHLIKKLFQLNFDIHVLDLPNCSTKRISPFMSKIKLYHQDITHTEKVFSLVREINPEYAFHLAGYGVNSEDNDAANAIIVNVLGGANIVKALVGTDCKKLVNIGSSAEYGNREDKFDETLRPSGIYGSSKAAATIIMHQIARCSGLGIVTLRPFNIYGEWDEPHKLFCYVILNLLQGKDIYLTPCEQERDYVYAGDVVNAMLMAAESELSDNIMDISTGNPKKLKYYVDLITEASGRKCNINYGAYDYRENEVFKHVGNAEKTKELWGWSPNTKPETEIINVLNWFKNNLRFYV